MPRILRDLFDLIRFRFQPLAGYVYPAWQPLAWLALIGMVAGINASDFQAGIPAKIAFFVMLNLIETVLLSLWLMIWWRFILRRAFTGSVFPLLALCTVPQLLEPLLVVLPETFSFGLTLALGVFGLHLLVSALAAALGERRLTVFLAILGYTPTAIALFVGAVRLAVLWGWIVVPSTAAVTG